VAARRFDDGRVVALYLPLRVSLAQDEKRALEKFVDQMLRATNERIFTGDKLEQVGIVVESAF